MKSENIRNVAIIAHVDHGKTTLVDGLLKQSNTFRENQAEMSQTLLMDSGDQESERGITITAKQTSIYHGDYKINIIDTPGHADFSGEVERTLNMADGVILVVDAQEGPMPQTKFVLSKALELGLKPIVVVNKIDKPARRITEVNDEVSDLFLELATNDDQLLYPTYYAIGRISRGKVKAGEQIALIKRDGTVKKSKIDKLFAYRGLHREEITEAFAGDIVAITGVSEAEIGETLADANNPEALPTIEVEKPTLSMYLGPNTSPMKGREGEFTTSRQIGDRLKKELETNVSLQVEESGIGFIISGRGELHLSVLIETLRREGFEFEVGRPQVVTIQEDGIEKEPVEELIIEVAPEFVGAVSQEMGTRRAEMRAQESLPTGATRLTYIITTRAMIGLRNLMLTATKGTIIMNSLPYGYQEMGAKIPSSRNGVLIAFEKGVSTPYALQSAESRGELFIGPGTEVYAGMIVGLNNRQEDLEINVVKEKHLTNMRSKSSDGAVQLTPFTDLSLEQCIDFIEDDELLEVTPQNLRLRKRYLDSNERKRMAKSTK